MSTTNPQERPEDRGTNDELARVCSDRAAVYALLSQLYRTEVTAELLEQLRGMRVPRSTGNEQADEGYALLVSYLSSASENALTELAVDYAHVFLGHGVDGYSAAYPYESVYTSEKRLLMQAARDEVLAIYRSQHLDKDVEWKESEDHLAVELEFMRILADRTAEALEQADEDAAYALLKVQANFIADHLAVWVPVLTADMRRFARTDLYRALALITDGFLETDGCFLAELLEEEAIDDER